MSKNVFNGDDIETIDLGRRIGEILDDKGKAYTVPALSMRIDISESTLYRIINGEREYIKPSELEQIAAGVGMTVERIKQEDTRKKAIELRVLIKKMMNPKRALQLALELLETAIGCTEKFDILNDLGSAHYFLKKYDEAQNAWLEALPQAEKIAKAYKDSERLYMVMNNLIIVYTLRKDFSSLYRLLERLEPQFEDSDPERAGTLRYAQAITAYEMENLETCKAKMYESLEFFRLVRSDVQIGKGFHNVAFAEHLVKNYSRAAEMFESSIRFLEHYTEPKYIAIKDYVKTLLKLRESEKAIEYIERSIAELKSLDLPQLLAKFYLLHAHETNNVESAKAILDLENAGPHLKFLSCKFLMSHYSKSGDASNLMKYYKVAESYDNSAYSSDWEGI